MQASNLAYNLASSTTVGSNTDQLSPVVSQLLNQVEDDVEAAREISRSSCHGAEGRCQTRNDATATQDLQNITDKLSLAKFEADKSHDMQMSRILEAALEDVAVSKFLNELKQNERLDTDLSQYLAELTETRDGYEAGDMVEIDADTAPLIFAGAGAFVPTPASVSAMLLGLEDAHITGS